jgi:uncharacterized membrane protein YwzB
MPDDAINAAGARVALAAAAVSRRRLLEQARPVSVVTQLSTAPMVVVVSLVQDYPQASGWWLAAYLGAAAIAVVGVALERRRTVRTEWGAAGPAGWLLALVHVMVCVAAWWALVAVLQAASVAMPHTLAGLGVVALLFASGPAISRAFRWLALRREIG